MRAEREREREDRWQDDDSAEDRPHRHRKTLEGFYYFILFLAPGKASEVGENSCHIASVRGKMNKAKFREVVLYIHNTSPLILVHLPTRCNHTITHVTSNISRCVSSPRHRERWRLKSVFLNDVVGWAIVATASRPRRAAILFLCFVLCLWESESLTRESWLGTKRGSTRLTVIWDQINTLCLFSSERLDAVFLLHQRSNVLLSLQEDFFWGGNVILHFLSESRMRRLTPLSRLKLNNSSHLA